MSGSGTSTVLALNYCQCFYTVNSLDRFIEATAGLLVSGVILLIISIVLLLIGLCSRSMNPQRKVSARAYTRIGAVVMIVASKSPIFSRKGF